MRTIIVARICYSLLVSLWTCSLYSKQAQERKSHPLSKNCCFSSSLPCERKRKKIPQPTVLMATRKNEPKSSLIVIMATRINKPTSTTYCTYGNKKKRAQTTLYCNYGNKNKQTHLNDLLYLWQQEKTSPNLPLL